MKNIRFISQYYYPDVATTGQLLSELAIALTKQGREIYVLTALPTYQKKNALREEVHEKVIIKRIFSTRFNKNQIFGKLINSTTFFLSALFNLLIDRKNLPLLIVSNPPFLPLVGFLLKKLRSTQYIFLIHDVYPDIAVRLGYIRSNRIIEKVFNYFNTIMLNNADYIIVLSDSMKKVILQKEKNNDTYSKKIFVIHNWADGEFIKPIPKEKNIFLNAHHLEGKFVLQYSGNMGLFHELEMIVEVARIMGDKLCLVLIGDGGKRKNLEEIVKKYSLKNVIFFPYQPIEMLPMSLTAATVSLVTLEENIEGLAMPSKLYTIMAAGNPVIAICDEQSDVSTIIQDAQCGFAIKHHDIQYMEQCLNYLISNPELRETMGKNARKYFENHFSINHAIEKYKIVFSLIDGKK